MSDAANNASLDGVVNTDGSVTISPDQVSRLSLAPGEHLQLVPARQRKSLAERGREAVAWQRANGVAELNEDETNRFAVDAARETRRAIAERQVTNR